MFSKFSRYWKTFLIVAIVVCFSLYTLFFLIYCPSFYPQSKAIIDIADVKEAQRIMSDILDKYWSESSDIKIYAFDIYWSKKDIMMDIMTEYYSGDLNSFKHFILVKIMGQIIEETEMYFRGTKRPWDNVTWIQYDRMNERMLIYHLGAFSGDDPGLGIVNALFYIDKYRFVIVNVVPAHHCLPNFTTFKYNGTYIKLPNPCSPETRKYWLFYYIYFRPPFINTFTKSYDEELAPVYVANVLVVTHNETDKALLDEIYKNYIEELEKYKNTWMQRFGENGINAHQSLMYFDLRKIPNTPNNTKFFAEFEKNITKSLWYKVVKPILKSIHVHANSLEDIMFAIVINKHEVIYLEPITPVEKH